MSDESRTVVLAQVKSEWHANLIADALRDKGIDAQVSGALTSEFRAEAPGYVRVIVPDDQTEQARAALEAHQREASEIEWSQVDVGEGEA